MCVSTFSNIFFSETTGPIEAKFHMQPPSDGGKKVCSNSPVLPRNQKADDLESWYIASGARVLPNLFK